MIDITKLETDTILFNHAAPSSWVTATLESRELLALCLKKLSLNRTRIIDASFIWTEPHSRRVRVKLTVQAAVAEDKVMQQTLEIMYGKSIFVISFHFISLPNFPSYSAVQCILTLDVVVAYQQCPECAKSYTANVWRASVQVRQVCNPTTPPTCPF